MGISYWGTGYLVCAVLKVGILNQLAVVLVRLVHAVNGVVAPPLRGQTLPVSAAELAPRASDGGVETHLSPGHRGVVTGTLRGKIPSGEETKVARRLC